MDECKPLPVTTTPVAPVSSSCNTTSESRTDNVYAVGASLL